VPGNVPFYAFPTPASPSYDSATFPGVEALNSNQLRQGLSAGPKVSLTYRDQSGYGVELSYFYILGLSAANARPRRSGRLAGYEGRPRIFLTKPWNGKTPRTSTA
jgi:hypothetical protein